MTKAIDFIKLWEKCKLNPYLDDVGVPTIGWGMTFYPNGQRVKINDKPITQDQADRWFLEVLQKDFWEPLKAIPGWANMDDGLRSALLSFSYNTGWQYMGGGDFATINRMLKDQQWDDIPRALMLYDKGMVNGKKVALLGLTRRRMAERRLILGDSAQVAYDFVQDFGE